MQDSTRGSWSSLAWGSISTALAYLTLGKLQDGSKEVSTTATTKFDYQQDLGYVMVSSPRQQNFEHDIKPTANTNIAAAATKAVALILPERRPPSLLVFTPIDYNKLMRSYNPVQPRSSKSDPKPQHAKANKRRLLNNG